MPAGAVGQVTGFYRTNRITCVVQFPDGEHVLPIGLLERVAATPQEEPSE
jgi:hypothetical protein